MKIKLSDALILLVEMVAPHEGPISDEEAAAILFLHVMKNRAIEDDAESDVPQNEIEKVKCAYNNQPFLSIIKGGKADE